MKTAVVAAIRAGARAYLRMPWAAGKLSVYNIYYKYADWRPHQEIVPTRFGAVMDLHTPDIVSTSIYATGQWEPCITQYIREHLQQGDLFVDVGANIGYFTLLAAKIVGPTGKVVAIEASPTIYNRLKRNIDLNEVHNVTAMNVAASSGPGQLSVFMAHANNLGRTTTVTTLAEKEAGFKLETTVPADSLLNLVGPSLFDAKFVKIDVEGAELSVLSPLIDSLSKFSSRTEWLLELSSEYLSGGQDDVDAIYGAFRNAGYSAFKIPNEYSPRFQLMPPKCTLQKLDESPRSMCDVLMRRT